MKALVLKPSNLCLDAFEDDDPSEVTNEFIKVRSHYYMDLNPTNASVVSCSSVPEDWEPNKYLYSNNQWTIHPDWVDPATMEEEEPAA